MTPLEEKPHHEEDVIIQEESLEDAKYIEEHIDFIVPQTDDPSTPCWTFRSVFIGTFFAIILSVANTALSFRSAPFSVPSVVAVILSYPIGLSFAAALPSGILNPGPFSMKEHVIIYILSATTTAPYGIDNVIVQVMPGLMNAGDITFMAALGFVLVTQFLGYGFSGLTRRFLVKPTAMWWPSNMTTIALFASFHQNAAGNATVDTERWTMSRTKFFWIAFAGMFVYEWIPEFLAPALQAVSIGCLIAGKGNGPSGVLSNFNNIAGSVTQGAGFLGMTFDWNNIGGIYFAQPFYANAIKTIGYIVFLWIVTPMMYAFDTLGNNADFHIGGYQGSLNPILNSPGLFVGNKNGTLPIGTKVSAKYFYNVSDNFNLDTKKYNNVAPVRITSMFALSYASSFLTVTAALVHVGLWYGKDIYRQTMNAFRQVRDEVDALDKHSKMMEAYPEVPDWVYVIFMVICMAGGLAISLWTPFGMPWWGIFFNIFMVAIFVVPYGSIYAITGVQMYLNVLSEFVIGLMIPGQTVAVMAFNLELVRRLKLGHYLHIPPYAMVGAQMLGTLINAVAATATAWFMMFNTNKLLGSTGWGYNSYQVFYSAGGIWGAIGPQRFFGIGSVYESLLWCFLIGAIAPVLPWLANKYVYKSRFWYYCNFPIFFQFAGVQTYQVYLIAPFLAGFVGQVIIFNRYKEFYQKYLYVMGAAWDAAAAIVTLLVAIIGLSGYTFDKWWALNPNTDNVAIDYYCFPGASYKDYDCSYYIAQGLNETAEGIPCA
ncbi:OPT superfamily oligopeptide transporter [Rhizoclosmatium globosum]|uniref:OPT superfamily oligopeptide transporter n=1 Tax=Rhizoclosmatium globosum TaxID=329046 RepID=A0A1Y2CFB0_9FUNG|nr:OPT superfamily oligopeptide transporter [Rhizoclosmatium globosum]|eukprot:ORY45741.1 OPT superfamily oligopeptide transporter [Rhizoclosmatium globosum]